MNFGFPQFLWALTALSIPLLIHLFNFRKAKTVYFSNTRFLKRLEQESKAVKKLRYWLVFALRALALSFLVFAFAEPELAGDTQVSEKKQVYHIYLDNSYSMKRNGPDGPLFGQAKELALEIIKSLPEQSQIQILSNENSALGQSLQSPSIAVDLVTRLDYYPGFQNLNLILKRIRSNYEQEEEVEHQVFLISDFQSSLIKEEARTTDKEKLHLIPLRSEVGDKNLAIDSVAFGKPVFVQGLEQDLEVWLQNESGAAQKNISLELRLNDSLHSAQLIDLDERKLQRITIPFKSPAGKFHTGEVRIDRGQPQYDNQFYFSFQNIEARKVYLITDHTEDLWNSNPFKAPLFEYRQSSPSAIDYPFLEAADLIILRLDRKLESLGLNLKNHLSKKGNIWLLATADAEMYQQQLASFGLQSKANWQEDSFAAQSLNYQDPFYQDVFVEEIDNPRLPVVRKYLPLVSENVVPLLSLSGKRPLIARRSLESGEVFFTLTPIDNKGSKLIQHESVLPLLINAALFKGQSYSYYLRLGQAGSYQDLLAGPLGEEAVHISTEGERIIPRQEQIQGQYRIYSEQLNLRPQHYLLAMGEKPLGQLALNLDRRESELKPLSEPDLKSFLGDDILILNSQANSEIKNFSSGLESKDASLGASFIFAVILFLALEMVLLWKRTT